MFRTSNPTIEQLESRIAPASVISYTDVDGDQIQIRSSKGNLTDHAIFEPGPTGTGKLLVELDLRDDSFANASIQFVVKRVVGSDGMVNVGFINAADNDLASVRVPGDLGRIVVGDSNAGTPALKLLQVRSMGAVGFSSQGGEPAELPIPGGTQEILDDLLGAGGLIGDVVNTLNDFLGDETNLLGLPSDVTRVLSALQANLGALDLANLGNLNNNPLMLFGLLENVADSISTLGDVPDSLQLFGPQLNSLLTLVGNDVESVLGSLQSALPDRIDLNGLLGLSIGDLLNVNLNGTLGGVLGGILGGGSGGSGGGTVNNLGQAFAMFNTALDSLIGSNDFNTVPAFVSSLLQKVSTDLDHILAGSSPLTSDIVATLGNLQMNLEGLLSLENLGGGVLSPILKTATDTVQNTLETLLGGTGSSSGSADLSLTSTFKGNVGSIRITADLRDAFLNVQGNLARGFIGGGLVGEDGMNGGSLLVTGNLGSFRIVKNAVGGDFANSGNLTVNGKTGSIFVGGSLIGNDGVQSGAIVFNGDATSLRLGGSLVGEAGAGSGSVMNQNGDIKSLLIGGSIIAGDADSAGTVRVSDSIQRILLRGSLIGDDTHRVELSAAGLESKNGSRDIALGNLTIGGSVRFADILAGYDARMNEVNGDAQITSTVVGRSWIASNLAAGVAPVTNNMDDFGEANNRVIVTGDSDAIIASISRIVIRGGVFGHEGNSDNFGFVAEQIKSFTLNGLRVPLNPGASGDNMMLSQTTGGDVTIREVSRVNPQ